MAKKATTSKTKKTHINKSLPKVSQLARPNKMSLEEWQILLRKQAAQKELLAIEPVNRRQTLGDLRKKSKNRPCVQSSIQRSK